MKVVNPQEFLECQNGGPAPRPPDAPVRDAAGRRPGGRALRGHAFHQGPEPTPPSAAHAICCGTSFDCHLHPDPWIASITDTDHDAGMSTNVTGHPDTQMQESTHSRRIHKVVVDLNFEANADADTDRNLTRIPIPMVIQMSPCIQMWIQMQFPNSSK